MKTKEKKHVAVFAAIVSMLVSDKTQAAVLAVDFNDNDDGPGLVQSGYVAVTTAGATITTTLGTAGTVTVSFPVIASLDDRDRGALTVGPGLAQSNLLRDFVFRSTGTGLVFELSNLKAGEYSFTGFFHDSAAQHPNGRLTVDLDGYQTGILGEVDVVSSFAYSTGTAPTVVGMATFNFFADGINPVAIVVRAEAVGATALGVINGFELTSVPEPSAGLLFVSVMGVGLLARRRA